MVKTRLFSELAKEIYADPERRRQIAKYRREMAELIARHALQSHDGASQQELANALGVTQAYISRIEHEDDLYLATLRGYVEALGGRLEVNAVFPDQTVTLIAAKP